MFSSAWCPYSMKMQALNHFTDNTTQPIFTRNGSTFNELPSEFPVESGLGFDDLIVGNSTLPKLQVTDSNMFIHMNYKYCLSMFPSAIHENVYMGMSIVCCLFIFVGNILVLVLPIISRTFRSAIFTTIFSFSSISLIHGIDLLFYSMSQCSIAFDFRLNSAFECMLLSCGRGFIGNIMSLHLSLLASQRLYLSLFPLKARVHHTNTNIRRSVVFIYFACILVELIMAVVGSRDCDVSKNSHNWSTVLQTYADFIVLNLITIVLLSSAMITGIVQQYISAGIIQSKAQRSQSRIASIIIALYLLLYCPFKIAAVVLQYTCVDPKYVGPIALIISTAQFLVNAFNPIILCLRVPEAKRALMDKLCGCKSKQTP
ncbi:LPAR3 [Mytilus coruscus]|uniref:LPAR3 n=1 Tax=Mytilus coruscus TaxID=42192 RepID=A0A6J8A0F5_MYTCO|nr:LPAR3 [Mytilus coruscus]